MVCDRVSGLLAATIGTGEQVSSEGRSVQQEHAEVDRSRSSPVELFFDLTYVFAFTQITALQHDNQHILGTVQALAVLAALWWLWTKYTWLTSITQAQAHLPQRITIHLASVGTFILALGIRGSFSESSALFGTVYLLVNIVQLVLAAIIPPRGVRRSVFRLAAAFLTGPVLIFIAGFVGHPWNLLLWVVGLAADFAVPIARRIPHAKPHARHFVERYRHVIIMAQGEAFLALGFAISAPDINLQWDVVAAAALGALTVLAMGWLYFDHVSERSERKLMGTGQVERARRARDSYSYLHLLLVAGIIFAVAGLEQAVLQPLQPLGLYPLSLVYGGTAFYLLAYNAYTWRDLSRISRPQLLGALTLLLLIPVAAGLNALLALLFVVLVLALLVAIDTYIAREVEEVV